jgi:hypothetical protein
LWHYCFQFVQCKDVQLHGVWKLKFQRHGTERINRFHGFTVFRSQQIDASMNFSWDHLRKKLSRRILRISYGRYSSARNSGHACNSGRQWKSDTPKDLRITQNRSINPIRTK